MLDKTLNIPDGYDKRSQRLIVAYKTAALIVTVVSLIWCSVFLAKGWWLLAIAESLLAVVGIASWQLIRAGRLSVALIFSQLAFLVLACAFCLTFDVPSATEPRVSHLFLLVLAALGYINYLRRRSNIQIAIIVVALCAFIGLASTNFAFSFAQAIPDDIRIVGAWINAVVATAMMCGCLYAIQVEFSTHNGIARALRQALRSDELQLFFQPQVDVDGVTVGAEALLRWKHPERGYVMPGEFIGPAEESGLMPLIGAWVLDSACRTLASWSAVPDLRDLTLAVNVSASQFKEEGFELAVLNTVQRHGVDPTRLKLELTESVIISGMGAVVAKMEVMRRAGITFALDDFGTGYSSLSYLRNLPIYQLKIDRSFVQEGLESPRGASLVKWIAQMGIELQFVVLAEGVEIEAQRDFLLECGCHEFQGYLFGRPVPLEDFQADVLRKSVATQLACA